MARFVSITRTRARHVTLRTYLIDRRICRLPGYANLNHRVIEREGESSFGIPHFSSVIVRVHRHAPRRRLIFFIRVPSADIFVIRKRQLRNDVTSTAARRGPEFSVRTVHVRVYRNGTDCRNRQGTFVVFVIFNY